MVGMTVLTARTNSGFSYPGSILYLSALYTFYAVAVSIVDLVKFRRLGSPILSAAKVLNQHVLTPILARFHVPPADREYLMVFYLSGLMAIIDRWLRDDCRDSIEHVIAVMQLCMKRAYPCPAALAH